MPPKFGENQSMPFVFQVDKRIPLRIVWVSIIFIYVLQYPLTHLLPGAIHLPQYPMSDWFVAYAFVLTSVVIFLPALTVGLSGKSVYIQPIALRSCQQKKGIGFAWVIIVFVIFAYWSKVMVDYKIGMTIYAGFDALPFRLTGLLFYGRLFLQPMVLAYISLSYANSKLKWLVFILLIAIGVWASLASGSRFVAIMFALPILMLFKGKSKYIAFALSLLIYIVIASLSRTFYLPFVIGDLNILQIYGNELAQEQESAIERVLLTPFVYIIGRTMGIGEVLMTLNFGEITPGFTDALQTLLAYFLPYIESGNGATIKNIYGLGDDAFGGYGLDLFSNFWVVLGGSPVLYLGGLALIGWLLGITYRQFAIGMARFGLNEFSILVFILLFILTFEARVFLFPTLLLIGWMISRKNSSRIIFSTMKLFLAHRSATASHASHAQPFKNSRN